MKIASGLFLSETTAFLTETLYPYLEQYKDLFNKQDYQTLYENLRIDNKFGYITPTTLLLYSSGIDVMKYLTYIPDGFLTGVKYVSGDIDIPDNITSIRSNAFSGCRNIERVTIGSACVFIGNSAFRGCTGLKGVNTMSAHKLNAINDSVFEGCSSLETIIIPDSVTALGNYCFKNCDVLNNVYISKNLQYSSFSPAFKIFEGCNAIEFLSVPEWVFYTNKRNFEMDVEELILNQATTLQNEEFKGCAYLKWVSLPMTLSNIQNRVFSYCDKLTSINYDGTKSSWKQIIKSKNWLEHSYIETIHCIDGDIKV